MPLTAYNFYFNLLLLTFIINGGTLLVGVVGGEASLESDSLGKRRFFGGATISEIGGESEKINSSILTSVT